MAKWNTIAYDNFFLDEHTYEFWCICYDSSKPLDVTVSSYFSVLKFSHFVLSFIIELEFM